jgi:hypothetical protein
MKTVIQNNPGYVLLVVFLLFIILPRLNQFFNINLSESLLVFVLVLVFSYIFSRKDNAQ